VKEINWCLNIFIYFFDISLKVLSNIFDNILNESLYKSTASKIDAVLLLWPRREDG
jgi:hypothetical protein